MVLIFLFILSTLSAFFYFYKGKGKINLLILGESGPGHQGATLTDTIIFSSISGKGTIFLSIPRDIWYQPWQTKINSVYFYGKEKGDGLGETKKVLGEILGPQIDYAIIVDFNSFIKAIDLIGGIEIEVERTFDDYFYPIPGKETDLCGGDPEYRCRYEHLHFEAGWQNMDGETTLKFVRSRNAEGEEGTDFARARRQQKVISAFKDKILSPQILLSPEKILGFWRIFTQGIKTDIKTKDLISFLKIFLTPQVRKMENFVLDSWQTGEGLLYHPKTHPSGQWVLLPVGNSWDKVRQFNDCLVNREDKSSCSPFEK